MMMRQASCSFALWISRARFAVALKRGGSLQRLGVVEVVAVGWIGKRGHVLV
jgi:hypothetical protein